MKILNKLKLRYWEFVAIKRELKYYKRFIELSPDNKKDKKLLPSFWGSFNKHEKLRWLELNMLDSEIPKYVGGIKSD